MSTCVMVNCLSYSAKMSTCVIINCLLEIWSNPESVTIVLLLGLFGVIENFKSLDFNRTKGCRVATKSVFLASGSSIILWLAGRIQ